jgi:hypothetical protein
VRPSFHSLFSFSSFTNLFPSRSPVAFERDTADPFGVDAFLESAKAGGEPKEKKRGLDLGTKEEDARKRARE